MKLQWCKDGSCVKNKEKVTQNVVKGGWSDWYNVQECSSACIKNSKGLNQLDKIKSYNIFLNKKLSNGQCLWRLGYQIRRRKCTNPTPVNTDEGCEGPGFEVLVCDDNKVSFLK